MTKNTIYSHHSIVAKAVPSFPFPVNSVTQTDNTIGIRNPIINNEILRGVFFSPFISSLIAGKAPIIKPANKQMIAKGM